MRLSLEQFKKYMDIYKKHHDAFDELDAVVKKHRDVFMDLDIWPTTAQDYMLDLLSYAMGVDPHEDEILYWWCEETNFGAEYEPNMITDNDAPEPWKHPDLSTVEKLYEYVCFLADRQELPKNFA